MIKHKIPPGHEAIITIKGDPEEPAPRKKRGPLDKKRPDDYLKRRRREEEDETILIKIYDMGQSPSGTDSSFFQYADPVTVAANVNNIPMPGNGVRRWHPLYTYGTDYLTSFNNVFVSDMDSWAAQYRRILQPMRQYGLRVNGIQTQDDGDGIEMPVSPSVLIESYLAFNFFGSSAVKVTSVPDFNAVAVPFAMDEDCDLYLAPRVALMSGRGVRIKQVVSDPELPRYDFFLNFLYRAMPRQYFLENALWSAVLAHIGDSRQYLFEQPFTYQSLLGWIGTVFPDPNSPTYEQGANAMTSFYNLFVNDPNTRNRRVKTYDRTSPTVFVPPYIQADITVPSTDFVKWSSPGVNDGLGGGIAGQNEVHTPGWFDYPFCDFRNAPKPGGLLLGGVKKTNGDKFYFWQPGPESVGATQYLWAVSV